MSQSPPKKTKPSTSSSISTYASAADCIIHNIIQNHNDELNKIIREAKDVSKRPTPPENFRQIPICSIGHPSALTSYTVEASEVKYVQDYPEWKTEAKAVPPYDLYFDKLTNTTPYIRALDLENTFTDLENSIPTVQMMNFDGMSDDDVKDWCVDNIWMTLQHITNHPKISFNDPIGLKKKIKTTTKSECNSVLFELRNTITKQQTIIDIQRKMAKKMIRESKTWGYYQNRIGDMGEVVVKQSVHKLLVDKLLVDKRIPSLTLSGFRISKYLDKDLDQVGITLSRDSEMDIATFIPNGDNINVNFVQTKVLIPSESEAIFEEKLKEKIKYSLLQTRRDVESLLVVMPDIAGTELDRLKFGTFSALPITARSHKICYDCAKVVLFKDDLHDKAENQESIAKTIEDVLKAPPVTFNDGLSKKFDLNNNPPPTPESLELYKKLNSRFIGLSSLHPMKDYSTFLTKQETQFKRLENITKKEPQKALYLTDEQTAALNNRQFALVGTYGSGKTTVLELSLDKILAKFKDQPRMIFFVVGEENSCDLVDRFKNLFNKDGVQVFTLIEIFEEFGLEYDFTHNLTNFNNLFKAIYERYSQTAIDEIFLLMDEINPYIKGDNDVHSFNWNGIDTRGIKLLLSLKPIIEKEPISHPFPEFPPDIPIIRLNRVLRCTQSILSLFHGFVKESAIQDIWKGDRPYMDVVYEMAYVTPGHEILGEIPEYVSASPCECPREEGCEYPIDHFLSPNFFILEAILAKLVIDDNIPQSDITIIFSLPSDNEKPKDWLVQQLENKYKDVLVKTINEFIGMESPVLIHINDFYHPSNILEAITRVTSHLIVINKDATIFRQMCQQGLMNNVTYKYKPQI